MDETQRSESCHLEARRRHTPFPAKLQNRSNLSYVNATMQALHNGYLKLRELTVAGCSQAAASCGQHMLSPCLTV